MALIHPGWLERYYRKAIVDLNDDKLTPILKDSSLFGKLKTTIGAENWKDMIKMRTYFMQLPNQSSVLSQTATSQELITMLGEFGVVYNEMYSKVSTTHPLDQEKKNATIGFQEVDGVSDFTRYQSRRMGRGKDFNLSIIYYQRELR